jgi:hypothetical protein
MKNEIKEVVTFKTEDDVEHKTRQAAKDHIRRKTIEEAIQPMVDNQEVISHRLTKAEVMNIIVDNFEAIGQLYIEIHESMFVEFRYSNSIGDQT